jgi:subtilisin
MKPRLKTYIIGESTQAPAGTEPVIFDDLVDEINELGQTFGVQNEGEEENVPAAQVIRRLLSEKIEQETLVVQMTDEIKDQLDKRHTQQALIIEPDEPLFPLKLEQSDNLEIPLIQNIAPNADTENLIVKIVVQGPDGEPVNKAHVTVSGSLWVDSGLTDSKGKVKLTLLGETEESISSIVIKPAHTYWSFRMDRPGISAGEDNKVALKRILSNTSEGDQIIGWGQKAMRLIGQSSQSKPVKIAVIDSGVSASHPDLSPDGGFDFAKDTPDATETWRKDGSGHGTHVSGVCAAQDNQFGILGFAPGAELVVLRVFPNASNSKLIAALNWCVDNDVDVINMSLGGKSASQLVKQHMQACRENGILPVAAAGNSGKDVLFPAAFSEVLAVAAIGQLGTFPNDSSHYARIGKNPVQSGDYFSPEFTCRGPEVDVCAPGVAIVSTVPGNSYAAWDGTSMACPHVAGYAARLLQTRDDLSDMPRSLERSQALSDAIIKSCKFLDGIPEINQGKGLPQFGIQQPSQPTDGSLDEVVELIDKAIEIVETQLVD